MTSGGLRWKLAAVLALTAGFLALALGGIDLGVAAEAVVGFRVVMLVPMAEVMMVMVNMFGLVLHLLWFS